LHELWYGSRAIGSSNAATILGINPYEDQTLQELWKYLTYQKDKKPPSEDMLRGREHEPMIRDFYCRRFDLDGCSLNIIDSEVDFIRAQIDFMDSNGHRAAEFKSTKSPAIIEALENNQIPFLYQPQLTHQCMLLGRTEMDLMVWDATHKRFYYQVFRADIQACVELRKREVAFWQRYVVPKVSPSDNRLELRKD